MLLRIDVGCGFVHDDDPVVPEHGPGEANELLLAAGQVGASVAQEGLEAGFGQAGGAL